MSDGRTVVATHIRKIMIPVLDQKILLKTIYNIASVTVNLLIPSNLDRHSMSTLGTQNLRSLYYRKEWNRYLDHITIQKEVILLKKAIIVPLHKCKMNLETKKPHHYKFLSEK